ncbi:5'-3' exonuclease H3TH domain-containing protein [Occallatibacter riparius]|uniref:5'-3' exonuclease domain-containing protein n=1 Tax=Occallatibacter riparius TaxID=1002689 RepID=A0A9J7BWZ8_9BACT|nr:5'-3' exonuclease H3TH domain-containing protein [Occallatibacter riparius]UWZ87025.1 hypothetical protein MOP44_15265 [Occallatibacter riparius]
MHSGQRPGPLRSWKARCATGPSPKAGQRRARVLAKFGVGPQSIPDYLALVGDAADGYPGLPGWGAKSTASVLSRFRHIEQIPSSAREWHVQVAASAQLPENLRENYEAALLFRDLATLRTHVPVFESIDELRWRGPTPAFDRIGKRLGAAVVQETTKHPSRRTAKRETPHNPAAQ